MACALLLIFTINIYQTKEILQLINLSNEYLSTKTNSEYLCLPFGFSGVHHSPDPIRIRHKAQGPVKPEYPGLRIQSNITNPLRHQLLHQPLHHRLPQPQPLKRGVHHHVPYDRVENAVPCRPSERHRPLRLPVLHPQQSVGVLQRRSDLIRVPLRKPDRHEDLVEVVQVELRDRAVEEEASGVQVLVGD